MKPYLFTVVIPAHNEERYIGACLQSVRRAAKIVLPHRVQIIVVANRCTDRTAEIARQMGAEVLYNEEKCIAAIRNTGVRAAAGKVIVTLDADSRMTKGSLKEIHDMLKSGRFIGGGSNVKFDRMSIGIAACSAYVLWNLLPEMIRAGGFLSGSMFWFYKKDFLRIGGFDERKVSLEDMDFAKRLKKLADRRGKKYGTLKYSHIITSSRKFDEFGDWYLIQNRKLTKAIFTGTDRQAADRFYYDVR